MSTYLLGWSVHNFKRANSSSTSSIGHSIYLWTHPIENSTFQQLTSEAVCLFEAPNIYSVLEKWTNVSSPIAKYDLFAVPDFKFNAMENWGFITFRESVSLIWNKSTTLSKISTATFVLGHEIAHTWFGNLVTPVFWNFAWLKEGFATYFSYLAMDIVYPDRQVMDTFSVKVLQDSMTLDSVDHERSMNAQGVGKPSDIASVLDFVTYDKG